MTVELTESKSPAERRLERGMAVAPYGLLVVSLILTWATDTRSRVDMPLVLGLTGLAAAWVFAVAPRQPATGERWLRGAVYMAGLLVIVTLLLMQSLWYAFFAWIGYVHSWDYLPGRWTLLGLAGTATVYVTTLAGGFPTTLMEAIGYVTFIGAIVGLTGVFGGWGDVVVSRSEQRRKAIDELNAANRRLETLIAENEGLQAQLLAQAREAGVLDERQRMAREIHDTLAQGLTGVITQLEAAGQARTDPEELQRHLDTAAQLARESLTEARRSVHAIGPASLEEGRLPDALSAVAERWSALNGVPALVSTTGDPIPLDPTTEVALLRVAQEALANVGKHAAASRVGVTLSYMGDLVTLDVRDDGKGFEPTTSGNGTGTGPGGFGLTAMRQRMQGVHGSLDIESEPGRGTAISASVPAVPAASSNG